MTIKKQADVTFDKGILLEKEAEFEKAKAIYEDLFRHVTDKTLLRKIRWRMEDIDDLIAEKAVYHRIDEKKGLLVVWCGFGYKGPNPLQTTRNS